MSARSAVGRASLLASLAILATAALVHGADGATLYVDRDGHAGTVGGCDGAGAAYGQIGGAVAAAGAGDTILVCPGLYGGFRILGRELDGLTVRSVEPLGATVRSRPGRSEAIGVAGARRVRIAGFRVLPANAPCGALGLITFRNASGWVAHNRLRANTVCDYVAGLRFTGADEPWSWLRVTRNVVVDFTSFGIVLDHPAATSLVADNVVKRLHPLREDEESGWSAILIDGGRARVEGNRVEASEPDEPAARTDPGPAEEEEEPKEQAYLVQDARVFLVENEFEGPQIGVTWADSQGRIVANDLEGEILILDTDGLLVVHSNHAEGGIEVEGEDLSIHDNDFRGGPCKDESTGDGTAGTANHWDDNRADASDPVGICRTS